jgi:hypothetical protein
LQGSCFSKNYTGQLAYTLIFIIQQVVNTNKKGVDSMEALQVKLRPLEVKADQKNRLQIPVLVRRMIKAGPGARFNLFVTEEGDLYFSKTEK